MNIISQVVTNCPGIVHTRPSIPCSDYVDSECPHLIYVFETDTNELVYQHGPDGNPEAQLRRPYAHFPSGALRFYDWLQGFHGREPMLRANPSYEEWKANQP